MSDASLVELIDRLLKKIAAASGYGTSPSELYLPLRDTGFSRRRRRYLPDPDSGFPAHSMPQDLFMKVREALWLARAGDGLRCLDEKDMHALDAAWERQGQEETFVSESIPKRFEALLRKHGQSDLGSAEGFMGFLYETLYRPMMRGERREFNKNLNAVLAAFQKRDDVFSKVSAIKEEQEVLLLCCSEFALYRFGDDRSAGFRHRLRKRHSANPLAQTTLLAHDIFLNLDYEAASRCLQLADSGAFRGWAATFDNSSEYVRAGNLAVYLGFAARDKPSFLNGSSVESCIRQGVEKYRRTNKLSEALQCEVALVECLAGSGLSDEALELAQRLRCALERAPDHSPFSDVTLSIAESRAYFAASRGNDKALLMAALGKVQHAQSEIQKYGGMGLKMGQKQYVNQLKTRIGSVGLMLDGA